jgi:hypothetical protein
MSIFMFLESIESFEDVVLAEEEKEADYEDGPFEVIDHEG